ncbi:MAG TPA: PqqD family protein [Pyrinomonadaceae bacterium]|nr:PqqD family protein [Pyrinomonadaceae bacterium]
MKRTRPSQLPRLRAHALVVHDLPDEVLVYDQERDQAHCLNQTAALVWRACDGKLTPLEIARKLTAELDTAISEEVVLLALAQLEKFRLLERSKIHSSQYAVISRRQMVRTLGVAVALPVITSIVAPTPAQAATCIPTNAPCSPSVLCCSPLGCNPGAPGGPKCR